MSALLEAVNLTKRYGNVLAVNKVNLTLDPGEVIGLVGPNGAGKTTLIDLITGAQPAEEGHIMLSGKPLSGSMAARARRGLARTFQHPQLALRLSVRQNIVLGRVARHMGTIPGMLKQSFRGLIASTLKSDMDVVEEIGAEFGIAPLDRPCRDLSLGEQRLVEVVRALVREPQVLLLDEPFAGSDSAGAEYISNAIRKVKARGHGVIVIDHNVDLVASLVDHIVLLAAGTVIFNGTPAACLQSAEMRSVYFGTKGDARAA